MYKVLVVEDEEIIRKGLIKAIDWASQDCKVVGEASNGKEALTQIASLKPDIYLRQSLSAVILNLSMQKKQSNMESWSIF